MFSVDVLLGLKNPDWRLGRFLRSLESQSKVSITLYVSDDGCSEHWLKEISKCRGSVREVIFLQGEQKGPCHNYAKLLRYSTAEYIAFADQDDSWLTYHLEDSCTKIENSRGRPAAVYCAMLESYGNGHHQRVWPLLNQRHLQSKYWIFENYARGCSMVMNKSLIELCRKLDWTNAIMHDWFVIMTAKLAGDVFFDPNPNLLYDIHGGNFTKKSFRKRLVSMAKVMFLPIESWKTIMQFNSLVLQLENFLDRQVLIEPPWTEFKFNQHDKLVLRRSDLQAVLAEPWRISKWEDWFLKIIFTLKSIFRNV